MKFTTQSLRLLLLGCVIPFVAGVMVYKGFTTNYTFSLYSPQEFAAQYDAGIYQYRVVGKAALRAVYHLIIHYDLPTIVPRAASALGSHGEAAFYSAYFYLNTLFLCLTCAMLFLVLSNNKQPGFFMVDLPVLALCWLMALTQYVVVPYDTLSYFWLSLSAWFILGRTTVWKFFIVCMVMILATLTRETAALIIAFYMAIHAKTLMAFPMPFKLNRRQVELIALTLCFLIPYIGIRLLFSAEEAIYHTLMLRHNLAMYPLLGVAFFVSVALLTLLTRPRRRLTAYFYIASLPYTAPLLLIANPWEIRLWTPVILLAFILKQSAFE